MEWVQTIMIILSIGAAAWWMVSRMDQIYNKLDAKIDGVPDKLVAKIEDTRKEIIRNQRALLWIQFRMDPTLQHPPEMQMQKSAEE